MVSIEEIRKIKNTIQYIPTGKCPYCGLVGVHKDCESNAPLISVIIPSRIEEEIESINSINNQTYKNIEIIIEYDKKREGAASTRNKGIKNAKGKYLFFCDNDVELVPDAIEALYQELLRTKSKLVHARVKIDEWISPMKGKPPLDKTSEFYARHFWGISTMSLVDSSVKPLFDPKMRRYDDWDLWMTLDKKGICGVMLDKVILTTKQRWQGISSQPDGEEWLEILYKKHGIIKGGKLADIIIPHHDRHDLLKTCLDGIDNSIFNIIIVSGGSFAENCNKGAKIAETNTLIFLNDDVIAKNDSLIDLANADYDYAGITQLVNNVKYYGIGWNENKDGWANTTGGINAGWFMSLTDDKTFIPSGYCFKVIKDCWEKLGGLNEIYKTGHEDVDFGLRALKNKFRIGVVDNPMVHKHSSSTGRFKHAIENEKTFASNYTEKDLIELKKCHNFSS
jgi:glycosyltransferase involved in cell wall biosynthesis